MFSGAAVLAVASSTRFSPSTRTCNCSRATPGRSASSVMDDSSSNTSTGGTTQRCCSCSPAAGVEEVEEVCTSLLMAVSSVHLDAAGPGGLALGDRDAQQAIPVGRVHAVRVRVFGQAHHAAEGAAETFVRIDVHALRRGRQLALAGARDDQPATRERALQ